MEEINVENILEDSQDSIQPALDQGAEEYVNQFAPEIQSEDALQDDQEAIKKDNDKAVQDDDEEDDVYVINYLKNSGFLICF